MDKDILLKYGPLAGLVIVFIFQYNIFVTPDKLEIKHRQIMEDVAKIYVTKDENRIQKEELQEMRTKIDKIYDLLINNKNILGG